MGMSSYWIDEMEKEQARLEEELYNLHQVEIAKNRIVIEQLKADIKQNLSKFDFDSLQDIEAMVKTEKSSRPEELYFEV